MFINIKKYFDDSRLKSDPEYYKAVLGYICDSIFRNESIESWYKPRYAREVIKCRYSGYCMMIYTIKRLVHAESIGDFPSPYDVFKRCDCSLCSVQCEDCKMKGNTYNNFTAIDGNFVVHHKRKITKNTVIKEGQREKYFGILCKRCNRNTNNEVHAIDAFH